MRVILIVILSFIFATSSNGQEIVVEPTALIHSERFDVMAKYFYAKHFDMGIKQGWPLDVYREHLHVWNNFHEELPKSNFPHFNCAKEYIKKDSFSDFLTYFHLLLESIKKDGFDEKKSVLPVDTNGIIIDGSHRLASALLYNTPVPIKIISKFKHYNSQFFKNYERHAKGGLGEKYLDTMALEYATLKQNTFIAILFPSANYDMRMQQIKNIFLKYGKIVYEKCAFINGNGTFNLMTLLYEGESWLGSYANNFAGAKGKANACFPSNKGKICIFLYEAENVNQAKKAKNEILTCLNAENYSIYINEAHEKTIKIAQTLFLNNGIHWLNNAKQNHSIKFKELLTKYINLLKKNKINRELVCVNSDGVLAAYGLRDCEELNFISYYDDLSNLDANIKINNNEMRFYKYDVKDIILDPSYHFYLQGIKFTSFETVNAMKVNRNEPKDEQDIRLINSIL